MFALDCASHIQYYGQLRVACCSIHALSNGLVRSSDAVVIAWSFVLHSIHDVLLLVRSSRSVLASQYALTVKLTRLSRVWIARATSIIESNKPGALSRELTKRQAKKMFGTQRAAGKNRPNQLPPKYSCTPQDKSRRENTLREGYASNCRAVICWAGRRVEFVDAQSDASSFCVSYQSMSGSEHIA